jgi:hypothetical protein
MDGLHFDTTELVAVVDAINKASAAAPADATAVVKKGAQNIKVDAARRISGHPTLRRLPYAIDYDVYQSLRGPAAEVGPNHDKRQGNLGHIPEYGSPTSAPIPYMAPAADAEAPKFARAVEDLAVKALGLG